MLQDEQNRRASQEFSRRKTRQLLAVIPVIFAIVVFWIQQDNPRASIWGLPSALARSLAMTLMGGALVFSFLNWRCPACGRYLGKTLNPRFCSGCGVQLRRG